MKRGIRARGGGVEPSSPGKVSKLAGDVDDLENDRFFQMLLEAP